MSTKLSWWSWWTELSWDDYVDNSNWVDISVRQRILNGIWLKADFFHDFHYPILVGHTSPFKHFFSLTNLNFHFQFFDCFLLCRVWTQRPIQPTFASTSSVRRSTPSRRRNPRRSSCGVDGCGGGSVGGSGGGGGGGWWIPFRGSIGINGRQRHGGNHFRVGSKQRAESFRRRGRRRWTRRRNDAARDGRRGVVLIHHHVLLHVDNLILKFGDPLLPVGHHRLKIWKYYRRRGRYLPDLTG